MKRPPSILIVDTDLGFVFWLGRALDDDGYQALPAKSVAGAISLLDQLKIRIDLLIINPSLQRNAPLIERLHRTQEHLRVIALSADPKASIPEGFNASKSKPLQIDKAAKFEWLELIRSVILGDHLKTGTTKGRLSTRAKEKGIAPLGENRQDC
jgi:ActR/RegA family two-component response regulator